MKTEKDEPGLDWDMWIGPGPMRGYSSVLGHAVCMDISQLGVITRYGGGRVTGVLTVDIIQWGLNKDGSGPVAAIPAKS